MEIVGQRGRLSCHNKHHHMNQKVRRVEGGGRELVFFFFYVLNFYNWKIKKKIKTLNDFFFNKVTFEKS